MLVITQKVASHQENQQTAGMEIEMQYPVASSINMLVKIELSKDWYMSNAEPG